MRGRNFVVSIIIALTLLAAAPSIAQAFPKKVERWRAVVRVTLKKHHVYSKFWETKELHIIFGESRGNTKTGHRSGCYGILQFDTGWFHHKGYYDYIHHYRHHHGDWRGCGRCSIHRFAHVLRDGGRAAVLRHWLATYY